MSRPSVIDMQLSHLLHGSIATRSDPDFLFSQFNIFAIIRAAEVLPVPFGPAKRKAWGTRPDDNTLVSRSLMDNKSSSAIF